MHWVLGSRIKLVAGNAEIGTGPDPGPAPNETPPWDLTTSDDECYCSRGVHSQCVHSNINLSHLGCCDCSTEDYWIVSCTSTTIPGSLLTGGS